MVLSTSGNLGVSTMLVKEMEHLALKRILLYKGTLYYLSYLLFFSGMASQRKMPEHTTTTKSAEVMRTNYSFLWQHLEPTQELQSKLVEKSFITEADKEEINSYRQRFAQNAVIIHRVLFSDQSPISLHEVLINTGQDLIAKKMMQGT